MVFPWKTAASGMHCPGHETRARDLVTRPGPSTVRNKNGVSCHFTSGMRCPMACAWLVQTQQYGGEWKALQLRL